jgi:hypothetical protein
MIARMHASRWAGVLALGAMCLIPGTANAEAAGHPGWRIVATVGPRGLTDLGGVDAVSPSDAWASGFTCVNVCSPGRLLIEHWNGTAWREFPDPAGLPPSLFGSGLAATSGRNVWMSLIDSGNGMIRQRLLHLLGHVWTRYTLPQYVGIAGMANFGRRDAWFFGGYDNGPKAGRQYNFRYTGTSFRRFTMPAAALDVSIVSENDIWAGGRMPVRPHSSKTVSVAMHWNGRSWRTIRFPSIRPPAGWLEFGQLQVALGPRNVWGSYTFAKSGCCKAGGLLHWDGRKWHRIRLPASPFYFVGNMVTDGRGGLWLEGGPGLRGWLYNYSGGRWSRFSIPTLNGQQLSNLELTWIPHTRSLWATAIVVTNGGSVSEAVILKYGR